AAPVSPLTWEGRLPDLVYQKSFNTLSKRHHIRIWNLNSSNGEGLLIGAATHDIGVAFDWGRLSLTHRVDLRIDRERNILLNDLNDADCMEGMQWLDRPALQSRSRSGNALRITDGGMAVVKLHGCIGPDLPAWTHKKPNVARLFARRIVLETRHYITRGNPYYYAFRAVRWSAFRKVPPPGDDQ
ncbi:MAG: LssY C-terminal domain-containing protein, partial [Acidobacteria bacterium]|nr:LssY C-terminal domain-containing protein [Acidobacteriota bacterium]